VLIRNVRFAGFPALCFLAEVLISVSPPPLLGFARILRLSRMTIQLLLAVAIALLLVCVVLLVALLRRTGAGDAVVQLASRLDAVDRGQERTERALRDEIARSRDGAGTEAARLRGEVTSVMTTLTASHGGQIEKLRLSVEAKLDQIRADNSAKLEQVRQTVDEKLQGVLEQRLGESFRLVSERLEQVHKGLGEMRTLASGVGDLKKVLSNVKVRGNWGEVQLAGLLEQVLTPDQYVANAATNEFTGHRVEFAIRLPGQEHGEVLLPIDAKFPLEDYQRLVDAQEACDTAGMEAASRALEERIRGCARDICTRYLNPPRTTDFGIMVLPTEGLYAEVVRRAGLTEAIQREWRVVVAGPTTLWAVLNSLQMGFRTLAIQQRSGEVWTVLAAVKTEFGKFGGVLDRVQKKLQEASNTMHDAGVRTRAIERKLRGVQELPAPEVGRVLLGESLVIAGVAPAPADEGSTDPGASLTTS
jgi:DNA recombination protein RmuC